ncbi:lysozyme inhibitor LprI family protein [Paraburkholderia sp. EG304]|uniref:lysozyme inhibitor LprI family protein n=1 Tax=Paraburkholderia sp. EG304 TaxID=3237015 RepID=UPI00397A5309
MVDGDQELRANGEPEALPYFRRGQESWNLYRDNECYAEVYEAGQASLRFVEFWDCMTRITTHRLDELTKPINQ